MNSDYDPSLVRGFNVCKNKGTIFGMGNRRCGELINKSCNRAYNKNSSDPKIRADFMTCMLKSVQNSFRGYEREFVSSAIIQARSFYIMAAQGALSLVDAIRLSDEDQDKAMRLAKEKDSLRRQRGLGLAMIGFCVAQGNSINICLGVPDPKLEDTYIDNGIIQKSVTSGNNRICYYNQSGSVVTQTIEVFRLCPIIMNRNNPPPQFESSGGVFRRNYTSGVNRICVYDNIGSLYKKTLPIGSLCPLTLN